MSNSLIDKKIKEFQQLAPFTPTNIKEWLKGAFKEVYEAGLYERRMEETRQ